MNTEDNPGAIIEVKDSGNLEIIKGNSTKRETETTDPRL